MGAIKCNDTLAVSIHRIRNSDLNEHGTVYGLQQCQWMRSNFCDHLTFKIQCVWRHMLLALGSGQLKCLQK